MALVFTDCRGIPVRLTDERLAHIREHPEMADLTESIGEVLSNPQVVVQSNSDDFSNLFYRFYAGTCVGDKYLCVVVKHAQNGEAFVLTAYLTDKIKKGAVLWKAKM